jgi:hypothetical protein
MSHARISSAVASRPKPKVGGGERRAPARVVGVDSC